MCALWHGSRGTIVLGAFTSNGNPMFPRRIKVSDIGIVLSDSGHTPCVFNNLVGLFFKKSLRSEMSNLPFHRHRRGLPCAAAAALKCRALRRQRWSVGDLRAEDAVGRRPLGPACVRGGFDRAGLGKCGHPPVLPSTDAVFSTSWWLSLPLPISILDCCFWLPRSQLPSCLLFSTR